MSFEEFAHLAARFLVEEEEDTEAILKELKDAFRLYDKEGLGYITTDLLKDILKELDDKMTPQDLNEMIEEIDVDKSGTVDWEGNFEKLPPEIFLSNLKLVYPLQNSKP